MFLRIVTALIVLLTTPSFAQAPDAAPAIPYPSPELAQAAVHFVIAHTVVDPSIEVPGTGKPLPADGKWSVSKKAPASCPPETSSCLGILYSTSNGVICTWTVLLTSSSSADGTFLGENDDASRYFALHLTAQETAASVLTSTKPKYPPIAEAAHVGGVVHLSLLVDPTGKVVRVVPKFGPPMLIGAASDAANSYRFRSTQVGARPVNALADIWMDFSTFGPGKSNIAVSYDNPDAKLSAQDNAEATGKVYKIGGKVKAPMRIEDAVVPVGRLIEPPKQSGIAIVSLIVDEKGIPRDVKLVRADSADLGNAAVSECQYYRFRPATKDGVAVSVLINVEVAFQIGKGH